MQTFEQWRAGFAVRQTERHAARQIQVEAIHAKYRARAAGNRAKPIRKYGIRLTADTIWSPGKGEHSLAGFHARVDLPGYHRPGVHSWNAILVVEGPGFAFTRRVSAESVFVRQAEQFAAEVNARAAGAALAQSAARRS